MSSRLSTYAGNIALNAITQAGTTLYLSLNVSDPLQSGSGEVTGGTYTRAPVVFGSASSGVAYNINNVTFSGLPPINQSVLWCGFWTAVTGGTYLFGGIVQAAGAYTLPWPTPFLVDLAVGSIVVEVF